ncbi:hypothetical protein [Alcaligenes faecalis]|uniref:Uncharacterized protein n=1 Tax=Alcaligenes faecalis TaxID=511 RepID=A0AAE9H514_ALCFA|nr:hypothetical protein [Alcaligenes faecalis]UPL20200.1 hypothetical protein MXF72_12270 [Alcaligenes faecalis]
MKVRAFKPGFYGSDYKNIGDTFEVPDGTKAKWFAKANPDTAEPANEKDEVAQGNRRGGGSRQKTDTAEPAAASSP